MRGSNTKILLAAILLVLLFTAVPAAAQEGEYSLVILHTNDVHARIDQFDGFGNSCDDEELAAGECLGGVARRKTMVEQVRGEGGNVVLLDGGDQFQGTLFYNQYKGGAAQEMMNALGYDAMAVGNHEFDDGPGTLGSFIRGAKFPVLSANIDASAEPELAGLIQPYTILDVGGEQIGVVGYTTEDTAILSSPGPNIQFTDIDTAVQSAVDELAAQGIDKIIAVSHAGFGRDRQVAETVNGLDVIVAGHTNTYLSNVDDEAEGPYPEVVTGPDGNPVLLVSDFTWGKYLGRLDVTFDDNGVATSYAGEPILLDSSVAQDPEIQARVDALAAPLDELRAKVVGSAAVDLDGERSSCRFGECTMGNLIADAMLWQTEGEGTQIAIQNGGGIRASIEAGDVTVGDVLTVLPFGNLISTFELTGAEVVQALENGVSRAENPENEGTGRFSQVAGLRYSWNPNQPAGARIVSVEVPDAGGAYSPIDPTATYKIASNDFMRGGGDGYEVFVTARNAYDYGAALDEAVQAYIAANSPVAPELEDRISQVAGDAMTTQPPAVEGETACVEEYVVQADDWLSKLAERFYGDPLVYPPIVAATNQMHATDPSFAFVEDPNLIQVGWKLCIPAAEGGSAAMDTGLEASGETVAMAEAFTETPVTLENGIAAIVTQPAGATNAPAVLLLHGFGSQKDEVGDMYKRLAAALAEQGIASLRIDYLGWGESTGDMAESTIQGHAADAETAYNYLASLDFVDPSRVGVVGFSLGGGIAIISGAEHPDWYDSMVVWSSVGDFVPDFIDVLGQESFDQAATDGVVTVDLGWREVTLNDAFFKSLEDYNLQELIASYPGALLAIAGSEDFSADYVDSFAANAAGSVKEVWVIEGGDHIYGVLGEDQIMADSVIDKTVQWFGETL